MFCAAAPPARVHLFTLMALKTPWAMCMRPDLGPGHAWGTGVRRDF